MVCGGTQSGVLSNRCFTYNVTCDTWEDGPVMNEARTKGAVVAMPDSSAWIFGGRKYD